MKKTIGNMLIVMVGLNLISIFTNSIRGDSIGSPMYLIILVMMLVGGITLISSSKKKKETTNLQKKDDK